MHTINHDTESSSVPTTRISDLVCSPKAFTVLLVCALATISLLLTQARVALLFLATDGLVALLLVATLSLAGTWLVPRRYLGPLPLRWHLLLGAGFGIGCAAAVVLTLGIFGLLSRGLWLVLLGVAATLALFGANRLRTRARANEERPSYRPYAWCWLCVTPFLALAMLVSVVPPGILWAEEGAGYDVLEYHLELPKEYYQQGQIVYTPHNVYGNFPANVEMLYLLSMIVQDDVHAGAAVAKCVNMLLGVLCVFAAYVAGRESSHGAGVFSAVICASVGWLPYLCGVAYVENGMLLFAMIAAAAILRAARCQAAGQAQMAWVSIAGLMSGFACGCKYSAVLLVAIPTAVAVVLMSWPTWTVRFRALARCSTAVLAAFAPWLIKNTTMTGNPVFPLAGTVFKAYPAGWGETESSHFTNSHRPDDGISSFVNRIRVFWQRIPADPLQRFGPLVFTLAAFRLLSRSRNRCDLVLLGMLVAQSLGWTFGTHLYARFAVPLVIPLVLLAGRSCENRSTTRFRALFVALTVVGVGFNVFTSAQLYVNHTYVEGHKLPVEGVDHYFLEGLIDGHQHLAVVNMELPSNSKILLIGDAKAFYFRRRVDYCVVFNRNPFIDTVRAATTDSEIMDWLRKRQYTHILVNWAEVHRLRSSRYGFPEVVQPELFTRLARYGLVETNTFTTSRSDNRYATLYTMSLKESAVPPAIDGKPKE